jgi:hypothetical protein
MANPSICLSRITVLLRRHIERVVRRGWARLARGGARRPRFPFAPFYGGLSPVYGFTNSCGIAECCTKERQRIANALRHANATRIEVEITYGSVHLRLRCRDNGAGMSKQQLEAGSPAGHWGITGMKERASRVGGRLDIWSTAGAGTEVEVSVPAAAAYFVNPLKRRWNLGLTPRQ